MYDKRCKAPEPIHWDGTDVTRFNIFKHKAKDYVLGSLPFKSATSGKGVRLASALLSGSAYEWYIAATAPSMADSRIPPPFKNFEELFRKLAVRFGIFHQEQNARQRLRILTTKPWTADYHSYFTFFQTLIIWCTTMDPLTMRNEIMFPLSEAIKNHVAGHVVETWEDCHKLISSWIINKGMYNQTKAPTYYHSPSDTPASTATPMEIGAVPTTTAARPPNTNTKPNFTTNKMSAADFWKDRQCLACGQYGHSKNYRGCVKHPAYKKPASRTAALECAGPLPSPPTYAAAVTTPRPPSVTSVPGASTSSASSASEAQRTSW